MERFSIRDKCRVNTNWDEDTFVGLKCENGDISINFPLGFDVAEDDKELRKDILLLINTIRSTTSKKDSTVIEGHKEYNTTEFPVQAYMTVIYDFYARGYYKERELKYCVSKRGKIDWGKTIKTQKAYMQNKQAYYLDFVIKKNSINSDELISLIHEYCVYESFAKMGWLFTSSMPAKPRIEFKEKLFKSVLKEKIANTFNDKNKNLFISMLAIVNCQGSDCFEQNYKYGTYRFEYVWEAIIDKVYGINGKEEFFPKTYWNINGTEVPNASLEPDTIMIFNGKVFVLDAKYYKYGVTRRVGDLPESTSVNKQITYGEYVAEQDKYRKKYGDDFKVYNAFLMPFNAASGKWQTDSDIFRMGETYGDWKDNKKSYERVQGILVDIKYLMKLSVSQNDTEIMRLAREIEKYV